MAETVKVSLLHPMGYRESKDAPITRYKRGLVDMPLEHAQAMGVTHRIRAIKRDAATGEESVTPLPFNGAFDEKLTNALTQAGYKTLDEVGKASQSELMAVEGIGPAAYERIRATVTKGA